MHVLPEGLHRELRLDRNRYAITEEEQERLVGLRVAVAGLSVGRAVVSTMAHEGIGGELRLADFDVLDLSNLNRLSGGVADVGVNKVVLAAREVAELDPYIRVVAFPRGVHETTITEFVADVDFVVDECDDLEMKLRLREHARAARRPVVMATSHRGMLDVERFDLEPDRPTFHGLLGDLRSAELGGLTTKQKVPYVIRIVDPASLTDRAAASMVEVKESVSTWPQLASDVALGGAMVANAVRRIALGELTASGRFYADLDELTAEGRQVPLAPTPEVPRAPVQAMAVRMPRPGTGGPTPEEVRFIVACASSAPSGGNMQPWRFEARADVLRAWVDTTRSSLLDFRSRAALLALGAALEAAKIGARALGFEPVCRPVSADGPVWELALERWGHARDEEAVRVLWQRCCNRRTGSSRPIPEAELARLARRGAPLDTRVVAGGALAELGAALGALDRVRFLSPRLRRDLMGSCASPHGRRRPRATASTSPRSSSTVPTSRRWTSCAPAPGWTSSPGWTAVAASATRRATRSRDRRARSSCVRRRSTAPRSWTPAAGSCACGSRRRATGWPSIRVARRSSSSACSRRATRWRGGAQRADRCRRRVRARRRPRPRAPGPAHPARVAGGPAVGALAAPAGRRGARLRGVTLSTPRPSG